MNTCGVCGGLELARRRGPAQPRSTFGSPETIIERGTALLSVQTERLGIAIARECRGLDRARELQAAIRRAAKAWKPVPRLARPLETELKHGAMLGALDADYEQRTDRPVAVESFAALHAPLLLAPYDRSTDPAFATRPVTDARRQFEAREPVTRDVWDRMSDAARRRSVTVAGAASADIVRTVQRELASQVAQGADLRDFHRRVVPRLEAAGWTPQNPSHAENVLRTNVGSAYNAGRARQMMQPATLRFRPFWQIITVNDGPPRQRRTHQAAHLAVLRADDPFWLEAYPPFGYQCRCRVRSLSQREGESRVISGVQLQGQLPSPGLPDPGFTSGLKVLDIPPPQTPPPANDSEPGAANDTLPPSGGAANDTRQRQSGRAPLDTPEAFRAHLESRGAVPSYISPDAHEHTRAVLGRDLTGDELDTMLGHRALRDIPGQRDVRVYANADSVQFISDIGDSTARVVRSFSRSAGRLTVKHDLLSLDPSLQGKGLGPRVVRAQLATYEKLGVERVELDAAWVGRYYWPKVGFNVGPEALASYRGKFAAYLKTRGASPGAVRRLTRDIASMRDIALTRLGDEAVGKDFLLTAAGETIDGLAIKVRPGDPIYDAMKREVSKVRKGTT